MRHILFFIVFLVSVISSNAQNRGEISVKQTESKYSTVIFTYEEYKGMTVQFYLTFDITNNTDDKVKVRLPEYIYKGIFLKEFYWGRWNLIPMFYDDNGKLEPLLLKDKRLELSDSPKKYIFGTLHIIDKKELSKPLFSKYLERMKAENKDTLHIGTISELKREKSPLLKLLEGDSIVIPFNQNKFYIAPIPIKLE